MAHPAYLRERARALRTEKHLTIDEIAERLALPRGTIFYWVKDIPLGRERRWSVGQRKGTRAMRLKYKLLRDEAYAEGLRSYASLAADPTFRDFIVLYVAEGYKRNRNAVVICNSDPGVVSLSARWIRRLATRPVWYSLQYHADQDFDQLRRFWGDLLGVEPSSVRLQRKSNSNQLKRRTWRSRYGVLSVGANDTLLRARLAAWIDCVRSCWE
jgi:transcriptional regulator with XRE-family HTH domain